ncbi:MAG: DUF433 domain-containing protein [Planctomycetes bacterium]|nr:DUF433 domain-containing protein [Planctomycetota bacterium]
MTETSGQITIVDRGRGPQLSNRRITVQHLLPMFREGASDDEIFRWYPQVSPFELNLLRQYYLDHTEEMLTLEREIAAHNEVLRKRYPRPSLPTDGMTTDEAKAWMLRQIAERKKSETNGVHDTSR